LTSSGTYSDTITTAAGTCDSVLILNLTVLPNTARSLSATICSNQVYDFNGNLLNTSGIYSDTLINSLGCDSIVILTLVVRSVTTTSLVASICSNEVYNFNGRTLTTSGIYVDTLQNATGCDSVVTLTLNVRPTSTSSLSASICSNGAYNFNGRLLTTSGIYLDTLTNLVGCDSVVTLTLNVRSTSSSSLSASICSNGVYNFNGRTLTTSGIYLDTLTNLVGCDSVVTLTLNVRPTTASSLLASICGNGAYNFNGRNLTTSGIYLDTLQNATGCDSVVTLTLNVRPTSASSLSASICSNGAYNFNGRLLTTSGIYLDTLRNATGCDSIITLTLNVRPTSASSLSDSICSNGAYNFNGRLLTTSGIYLDTLTNLVGCDSVVTLTLNVRPTSTSSLSASICSNGAYNFNGRLLTTSGVYLDTLRNATGCDSIITLTLNIRPTSTSSLTASNCSNGVYNFNGRLLTTSGIYLDTLQNAIGCDSVVTLTLNVRPTSTSSLTASICSNREYNFNGRILTTSGTYLDTLQNATGCDSVVTLTLNVRPTSTSSLSASICNNGVYNFNGRLLTISGIYLDTLQNATGCDSVVTLTLNIRPIITSSFSVTICYEDVYHFNGRTLALTGIYRDTIQNASGCDSVIILTLNVRPPIVTSLTARICSNSFYNFIGRRISVAGRYERTLQSALGCDSLITLSLNVYPAGTISRSASICSNGVYNFNGRLLTTSGIYLDTLTNLGGCDSVVSLTLNVRPIISATNIRQDICQGNTYVFNNQNLSTSGNYSDTLISASGCDSIVNLNLVVNTRQRLPYIINVLGDSLVCSNNAISYAWYCLGSQTPYASGKAIPIQLFHNSCGTAYVICTYNNGCPSDTSNFFEEEAVNQKNQIKIEVYPIPASDLVNIVGLEITSTIQVYDSQGKLVLISTEWEKPTLNIAHLAKGVYQLVVTQANGRGVKTIVKE
jgi:Secretion system C-terminal sorting domain